MVDREVAQVNLTARYEERVVFASDSHPSYRTPLPVTVLTGFLGAGKSTLLRSIVLRRRNLLLGLIVHDVAALNIDERLVAHDVQSVMKRKSTREAHVPPVVVIGINNGCYCCKDQHNHHHLQHSDPNNDRTKNPIQQRQDVREDLVAGMWSMLEAPIDQRVEAVIVETSGITDPNLLISDLDKRYGKLSRCRLDHVVTVIDSEALGYALLNNNINKDVDCVNDYLDPVLFRQISCADVIVLNKTDLATDEMLEIVRMRIAQMNARADIIETTFGRVPIDRILNLEPIERLSQVVSHESGAFESAPLQIASQISAVAVARRQHDTNGTHSFPKHNQVMTITFESKQVLSLGRFQDWMFHTLSLHSNIASKAGQCPSDMVIQRAKAILCFEHDRSNRWELHISGRGRIDLDFAGLWTSSPSNAFVFIGKSLDTHLLTSSLAHCFTDSNAITRHLSENQISNVVNWIEEQGLFEMVSKRGRLSETPVCFIVTGGLKYGITSSNDLLTKYSVDADALQRAVARSLGNLGYFIGTTRLQCSPEEDARTCLIYDVMGNVDFRSLIGPILLRQSLHVLEHFLAGTHRCACGI